MPRSQERKKHCITKDVNQISISKYFSASATSVSENLRKRSSSVIHNETTLLAKEPKFSFISCENRCDPKTNFSIEKDQENDLGSSSENLNKESEISDTKSRLLSFSYCKRMKLDEESNLNITETLNKDTSFNANDLPSSECISKKIMTSEVDGDGSSVGKNIKYTPLEKQYLEFQVKYPDAVLLIECGYKFRFFGKDAEIAHKDLNIGCNQYHNFLCASIPVHRLQFHVRRLVLKGYKVGIIKQTESAALKAVGETRNELFTRELYAMYTKSTFIEGELSVLNDENSIEADCNDESDIGSGYLMCINETQVSKKPSCSVSIAFVAVQIHSGDIFYSSFQDSLILNELERYLMCINPSEILLPSSQLSDSLENMVKTFSCDRSSRIERLDEKMFEPSFAMTNISSFISSGRNSEHANCDIQESLQTLLLLPSLVIPCLSALKVYLSELKVENILKNVKNMRPFSTDDHMVLNAATIRGLEILRTNSNPSNYGTLMWSMNQTFTKFGERLLRLWILKPLKDIQKIEERLNIVTEIIHSESVIFKKISNILHKMPDLEKLLCSAFYHKCSCYEFLKLVKALTTIRNELLGLTDKITMEIKVEKLKNILLNVLNCLEGIDKFSACIDLEAAKEGNKVSLFLDSTKYPSVETSKTKIRIIENKLNDLRPSICKVLHLVGFKYATVAGQKFLIEVPNSNVSLVPDEWLKHSATKQVSRFRSPEIIDLCKELEQEQEKLLVCANEAWDEFLDEFGNEFYKYKCAVSHLAELDCFLSFSKVSKEDVYCRPLLIDTDCRKFELHQSRHPMAAKLIGEGKQFVANDIQLNDVERCLIVTGPNMGGKSTYIRQVALLAIMAHIGCYIPAESATMPLLDGIYVRIGADDDIVNNKSTFMSEMCEASNILSSATSKSLVIFDELGRGTSTNDGTAIAYSTLEYLIKEVQCFTLFVTHYPPVVELKNHYPNNILTVHMGYILKEMDDNNDIETVTFLYNVVQGASEKSYGINVAALAGISKEILLEAQKKAREVELKMALQRQLQKLFQKLQLQNF